MFPIEKVTDHLDHLDFQAAVNLVDLFKTEICVLEVKVFGSRIVHGILEGTKLVSHKRMSTNILGN